ncbi:hypothetical protein ACLIJR_08660 [Hydrogenophaga sp. XSHU_21]
MSSQTPENVRDLLELAARALGLPDAPGVSQGRQFDLEGITCQFDLLPTRRALMITCDIGDPLPGCELEVYRHWLELQQVFIGEVDASFVRDPVANRHLFTVRLPWPVNDQTASLANAVRACVDQVRRWQSTLLQGLLVDHERELERLTGADRSEPA